MADQPVKLLLTYDIDPAQEQAYRRFVLEEFLPQAQEMGLQPTDAWYTAYGHYPARLLGFLADDKETMDKVRSNPEWDHLIQKLDGYTQNLHQRLVLAKGGFQW